MTHDDDRVCWRCLVAGRVQGVWFRGATRQQAQRLGVSGHARNLADGRVEVVLCGTEAAVTELHVWLHQGPPAAQVVEVMCTPFAGPRPVGFVTG
ncbi:acylphosphatase [Marichromatium bheemlicum]|uniref:acylphosphatase n=1 Tax=Marichromatium bheemlicum TaxID=365339 RepID=A0ABX1I684_9GAMM|nr:acylphosphatase [Marichromatium bheemlicum]NKN32564.1 acylphosphatase [Marichromatium bheemlicum]